jgi:phosphate transport system ATP-binding protein
MTAPSDQPRATLSLSPAALQGLEAQAAAVDESDAAATQADDLDLAITVRDLSAWYGARRVIRDVSMDIRANAITAIIGPSGSGKSTLLRCLDRMHEVVPGARSSGKVTYQGVDIYDPEIEPAAVRRTIGMVFQQPNPFPTMSIYDNVAAPARFNGLVKGRSAQDELVERCLRQAALWDEVKDKLGHGGTSLSGGQQQRLCIARTLALRPKVLLMDEPCSALDPIATLQVEQLMATLKAEYTIIIVTHNMQQASRVSDVTAFFNMGEDRAGYLVESDATRTLFTNPKNQLTEDYVSGRFG